LFQSTDGQFYFTHVWQKEIYQGIITINKTINILFVSAYTYYNVILVSIFN